MGLCAGVGDGVPEWLSSGVTCLQRAICPWDWQAQTPGGSVPVTWVPRSIAASALR